MTADIHRRIDSLLLNSGADPFAVRKLAGHSDVLRGWRGNPWWFESHMARYKSNYSE